jgi:hypothetical protein
MAELNRRTLIDVSAPKNGDTRQHRIMIGTPTLGQVRIEWHNAMQSVVIPTNWASMMQTPIGWLVDDAQNIICHEAMKNDMDWVLFIEDDVVVPIDLFQRFRTYANEGKWPIVAGLYHLKSDPPEPMVYRGRGNGPYLRWKQGEVVRVDAVPTGCTLISTKLIKAVAAHRREHYTVQVGIEKKAIARVFETPRGVGKGPNGGYYKFVGTSDMVFCDYVLDNKLLGPAGWPQLAKEKYPFLVDTRIACGHIDRETGQVY